MQALFSNVRYAVRRLWLSPVFTAAAVLVLALGIGGTTAIFTLIDAIMLRSLPVSDPGRLYRIGDGNDCCVEGGLQTRWGMYPFQLFERLRAETPEFEAVTAFQAGAGFARMSVRRAGREEAAKPLHSEYVTGNYFSTLGVRPFAGRLFTPDDDKASAVPVAALSYHAWETEYGADASVLGSTVVVEGHPFTIAGIGPPGFIGETLRSDPPEIFIPLQQEPMIDGPTAILNNSTAAWLRVIGRLRPGASTAGMAARLTGLLRQWLQGNPGFPPSMMPGVLKGLPRQLINVVPAGAGVGEMKEQSARSLQILLAVCGLVLLIACANVANLLLARSAAQRGQTAVRLAMGASRGQIVMQALTESVVLAIAGAVAGLLVASVAARLLLALAFRGSRFLPINTAPSPLVLALAFLLALVTGLVFGAAPAWFATRTDPAEALRASGRGTSGSTSFASKSLLIFQAALSVVLVAGAAMLARSLGNLEDQDFGYRVNGSVLVELNNLPSEYESIPKLRSLYRALEDRFNRIPGVSRAGVALYNPLTNNWGEGILVQGHPLPKPGDETGSSWDRVSAGYMQALGMTILRGRGFTDADNENTAPVAIVNQAFVKRFFKSGEEPLDQHFGLDVPQNAGTFRIVGIAHDAKFQSWRLNQPVQPMLYVPMAQAVDYKGPMQKLELASHRFQAILLQTGSPPGALEPVIRKVLTEVDPNLTLVSVRTLQDQVAISLNQPRAVASLAALFGIVALLLAAVGLYGVTAYAVAQRTNEIGIRMALGADRGKVIRLILRGASMRALLGLAFGVPLAIGAGRLISAQLYGISSWDPAALALAAATLAICAFIAALIPARRAASIAPMDALRTE